MFVKRFIAADMQEAIRKINKEFGNDAVILENKSVRRKGLLGFFKKKVVEVVAAYEPNRINKQSSKNKEPIKKKIEDNSGSKSNEAIDNSNEQLGKQMQELKDVVQEFTNKMQIAGRESMMTYPADVLSLYNRMLECDVQEDICKEIAAQIQNIKNRRGVEPEVVAHQLVLDRLGEPMPLKLKKFEQNVLLFAGPTGAGKTTTLAKLAGNLKFKENLDVGMINTDTYRVGAMEHIRIYSQIMDIPLVMAYNAEELKEALRSLADKDVVLIDTAGKSARDEDYKKELDRFIAVSHPDEVYLVLSAVTGCKTCKDMIDHYSFIKDYKLIITKLDEVSVMGNVLNIADFSKMGISYVTMGQNVPDDIREVDTQKLASSIISEGEMRYD